MFFFDKIGPEKCSVILLMKEILHQLRLVVKVVYPMIYWVLYIPGGCLGFQPSTVSHPNFHQFIYPIKKKGSRHRGPMSPLDLCLRWFLEEAADFLAKELRDWRQVDSPGVLGTVDQNPSQNRDTSRPRSYIQILTLSHQGHDICRYKGNSLQMVV